MKTFFFMIVVTIMSLSSCKSNKSSKTETELTIFNDLEKPTIIPYKYINGLIVLKLRINKSKPLNFIFDTGAPKTLLFESDRTDGFKEPILESDKIKKHVEIENGNSINFIDGLELNVGNITLKNLSIALWPSEMFFNNSSYDNVPYDGVIGYDLLKFVALEINRKDKSLTFHNPNEYILTENWSFSNLELKNNKPYCDVNLRITSEEEKVALKVHFDLGNMGYMWVKTNDKKGVIAPSGKEQVVGKWLNGKPQIGIVWPVHNLEIFGNTISGTPIRFLNSGHPRDLEREGTIGVKELQNFDLIIDYVNKKIGSRPLQEPFVINEASLELYNGEFSSQDIHLGVTLERKRDLLYFKAEGQNALPLTALNNFKFKFKPSNITVVFSKTSDGKVDYTSFLLKQKNKEYLYTKSLNK